MKMIESELYQTEQIFKELLENISNGIAIYETIDNGNNFIIKEMNKAGLDIYEVTRNDIIGKKLSDVFPRVEECGFKDTLNAGETKRYRVNIQVPCDIPPGDEWFIEAIGSESYGHLDPNNWIAEDLFNDYTVGDLNGQGSSGSGWDSGWSGVTQFDVTTNTPYEGTKCVQITGNNSNLWAIERDLTSVTDGTFYISARTSSVSDTDFVFVRLFENGSPLIQIRLKDNEIQYFDGNLSSWVSLSSISANTWYRIGVSFDCSTDTYDVNVNDGTWTTGIDFQFVGDAVEIFNIREQRSNATIRFDTISPDYTPGEVTKPQSLITSTTIIE